MDLRFIFSDLDSALRDLDDSSKRRVDILQYFMVSWLVFTPQYMKLSIKNFFSRCEEIGCVRTIARLHNPVIIPSFSFPHPIHVLKDFFRQGIIFPPLVFLFKTNTTRNLFDCHCLIKGKIKVKLTSAI